MLLNNLFTVFDSKIQLALKNLWILLILFFCSYFLYSFEIIESQNTLKTISFMLFALILSWYFIANKLWLSAFLSFALGILFKAVQTNNPETSIVGLILGETGDSSTYTSIRILILITYSTVISYLYLKDNVVKTTAKQLISTSLTTAVFILTFNNIFNDINSLNTILQAISLEFIIPFVYTILITLYLGSLLFTYFLLLNNFKDGYSLNSLNPIYAKNLSDNFTLSFPILYHAFFLTVLSKIFSIISSRITLFYIELPIYAYINLIALLLTCLIIIILISQMLKEKAKNEGSFYGLYGTLLYLPFLNLVFYLLQIMNSKYKMFAKDRLYTDRGIHILLFIVLFTTWHYYDNNQVLFDHNIGAVITAIVIILFSTTRYGNIWVSALTIAILSLFTFDIYQSLIETNVFPDELIPQRSIMAIIGDLLRKKHTIISILIIKFITYIGYIFIVRYTFATNRDENEEKESVTLLNNE